jgi:glycosyltransferase involved in cell wall biosynthesis
MESITFVSPRYPPYIGGVETHVAEITARASARFRRVSVVTTDPSGDLPATQSFGDVLTVFRVRSFAPGENYHFPISTSLVKILRTCRSRILHLHSIHDVPGPLAAILEANSDSSIVFTPHFHGEFSSHLGKIFFEATLPILRRIMDRVNCIICVSKFEARLMTEAFPSSAGKITVIPNGVDSELLSDYSWSPPATPRILFVGRLERYKNVDKILAAFAVLREKRPDLRLTVVGRGPLKEELFSLSQHLRLGQSVEWLEGLKKPELYDLYRSSTMFVLPSYLEAYGIVVAEAVAVGTPSIVANSSALSEFARSGLAIPVEPPVEIEKLVDAMSLVLEDPKSYSPRGRTSDMIQSWDDIATKTFDAYQSLA